MQAQLAEAGMTVKIKLVDAATQLSDGNSRNFDMISYQWSGRPDPDGNTYQFFRTTPGTSLNWSGISNPQIDTLLDKTREVSNQAERKKLFSELTKILQDELPDASTWKRHAPSARPAGASPGVTCYRMRRRPSWPSRSWPRRPSRSSGWESSRPALRGVA